MFQLVRGFDEYGRVTNFSQRPRRIPKTEILLVIEILAKLISNQPKSGTACMAVALKPR